MAFFDRFIKDAKGAAGKLAKAVQEKNAAQESASSAGKDDQQKVVTIATLINSIDNCKVSLIKAGLSPEEVAAYTDALTTMQQALRGLHAATDITDLLNMLDLVFTSSMTLTFRFGFAADCQEAVHTIANAIKTIPSTEQSAVLIAALRLSILSQNALIYQQNRIILRYQSEVAKYREEQMNLLKQSGVKSSDELSPFDANLFYQIDQRVQMRQGRIDAARMLISTYNQEIVAIEGSIENIEFDPDTYQSGNAKEQIRSLRSKAPSGSELAVLIEEAAKEAEVIAAEVTAETKLLRTTIDEHLPMPPLETLKTADEMLTAKSADTKTAQAQTQDAPEMLTM